MQYLVLHDKAPFSALSMATEGTEYPHPIKCWAIDSGAKMEFVHMRMAGLLSKYYVSGTYQQTALYALPFEEMALILTNRLGLDDEARYRKALDDQIKENNAADGLLKPWPIWFVVLMNVCELLLKLAWGVVKLLSFVILIPFVIKFFKSIKK